MPCASPREDVTFDDVEAEVPAKWRAFQLAFLLLNIPTVTHPDHEKRSKSVGSYADLLWFPTGGGKTEAYLGVAAFSIAMRRLQGEIGGYEGDGGVAVIMRYTLGSSPSNSSTPQRLHARGSESASKTALTLGPRTLPHRPWVGGSSTPTQPLEPISG